MNENQKKMSKTFTTKLYFKKYKNGQKIQKKYEKLKREFLISPLLQVHAKFLWSSVRMKILVFTKIYKINITEMTLN